MKKTDLRRFTRVDFSQTVRLHFGGTTYEQTVSNISLGGVYVNGCFDKQFDGICTIEAGRSWPSGKSVCFRAKGTAVRCTEEGMAIAFVAMPQDSLQLLQTALLYKADDPVAMGTEFSREVSFQLEEA
jgi:hypothetical protein